MPVQFDFEKTDNPIIKVIGVGGGGSNAVNHMYQQGIIGVDFAICNTDKQALEMSKVPLKIQLGVSLTNGLGAGSKPEVGREACLEALDEIKKYLSKNTKMLFITAGMGGGTGTGAAPVIAKASKELDILTVAIVTIPFAFEGRKRAKYAKEGIEELKKNVDSLIVISNENLMKLHGNLQISEAFAQADNILSTAAKGIAEIITISGHPNVDFEDVQTVMKESGVSILGTGEMDGEDRARRATEAALSSPLLEDNNIQGARDILLNISYGDKEVSVDEIKEITEYIQEAAGQETDIIFGISPNDDSLGDKIMVTIIAAAFDHNSDNREPYQAETIKVSLENSDEDEDIETPEKLSLDGKKTQKFVIYDQQDEEKKQQKKDSTSPLIENEITIEQREKLRREQEQRIIKFRTEPRKLTDDNLIEFEKEPAFKRRNVVLEDTSKEKYDKAKRTKIDEDGEIDISDELDNSYLHKNVD